MKHQPQGDTIFSAVIKAPFGAVGIRVQDEHIREIRYVPASVEQKAPSDNLSERAMRQIERYLIDPDFRFDLPLMKAGTEFQRRVWCAISSIPRGETLTYGQIARRVQSAPRAVGQACGANWHPLIVPCHRVTALSGIGGFAHHDGTHSFYLGVKRWLLTHEGVTTY